MATYIVTTSNWNESAFWASINEAGPGHTLDFSALPSTFEVDFWPDGDRIVLSEGTNSFVVGDSDFGGSSNATMGGTTQLQFFTTVVGSDGNDMIDGEAGDDNLSSGSGDDTLTGNGGDDFLRGRTGNDSLVGGAGNDSLQGEEGNDTIDGGTGSDSIYVSDFAETDQIDGGESSGDNDELIFVSSTPVVVTFTDLENGSYAYSGGGGASGTFANIEHFKGGSGNDTLDLSNLANGVTVTFTSDSAGTITDGTDTITFSNIESMILTDDADVVDASLDSAGIDVDTGAGNDSVFGGIGDDTIEGGSGDDRLLGGAGNDSISAGTGVNLLDGGSGADTIDGTGGGYDILTYQGSTAGVNVDVTDGIAETGGYAQGDVITGVEQIDGSNFNDTLIADNSGMELQGRDGDNSLRGGGGNDSIRGDDGNDSIMGGDGNDTIFGGDGADQLSGGADADTFIVQGSFGNDTIIGGEGTTSGSDNDVIDLSALSGPVTVTYTGDEAGTITNDTDTITFSEIEQLILTNQADVVDASADSVGIDIDAGGGDDRILSGDGNDYIAANDGNDTIEGGAGDDDIEGGDGVDFIDGGSGNDFLAGYDVAGLASHSESAISDDGANDTLIGGTGNDTLLGGGGADSLSGGADYDSILDGTGNDTIEGGAGDDLLAGEGGDDTFIYAAGDGNDTITDFNTGNTGALNDGDSTNNDFVDLTGFYDNIFEVRADHADDGILNQSNNGQEGADYSDNDSFGAGSLTVQGAGADGAGLTTDNTGVICFTPETLISTPRGDTLIEHLCVGDLVNTADNGPQPIRWIGQRDLDLRELHNAPNLRPVLIKTDVLGNHAPLLVSQQHGLVIGDRQLVRAKHLAATTAGTRIAQGKRKVRYIHLMFDAHQIIFANGTPCESFYHGPLNLGMLDANASAELFEIFPELMSRTPDRQNTLRHYGQTARTFTKWKDLDPAQLRQSV